MPTRLLPFLRAIWGWSVLFALAFPVGRLDAAQQVSSFALSALPAGEEESAVPAASGWVQRNISGFGDEGPHHISGLEVFQGQLYSGTGGPHGGGDRRIMRLDDAARSSHWTEVVGIGFGRLANVYISDLTAWNGYLYASTQTSATLAGGEIWRSDDGKTWDTVITKGFGDPNNTEIIYLAPFKGTLLAGTWNQISGAQIWQSSNGIQWNPVVSNGLGKASNQAVLVMTPFNGALYAGTWSVDITNPAHPTPTGCEVWRSETGAVWTPVVTGGLGGTDCYSIQSMMAFGDYLYAGIGISDGAVQSYPGEIWRCSAASGCDQTADWQMVAQPGLGNPHNLVATAMAVMDDTFFAAFYNRETGMEVWRSADGETWTQVGFAGFGDANSIATRWQQGMIVWDNTLWVGVSNNVTGGQVWQYIPPAPQPNPDAQIFLPLIEQ